MLLKPEEINQIKSHFVWTQEEKNRLLSHIEDLESLVDPNVRGLKYIEQQMKMLAEMQKDLMEQKTDLVICAK